MGILKNVLSMVVAAHGTKQAEDVKKTVKAIKKYSFDLIRCLLDCVVGLYFWKHSISAKKTGVVGVISTIMYIMQLVEKM